ncbi:MAG TPA: DUF192 domain-containing protein [Candidatus Paceibacterota bacterium]|nr:DUF192 domain-containing protein [Candidatus Paceibacterota bacterium]
MSRLSIVGIVLALACLALVLAYRTPSAPMSEKGAFGGVSLNIDFALTSAAREKGLGGRTSVPADYGMLFVFPNDGYYGFWMKDTLVPLDMFWLDDKGQVVSMHEDVATSSFPAVFYPTAPARYVLETAAGFGAAHDIATGTPLVLQNWPVVSQ